MDIVSLENISVAIKAGKTRNIILIVFDILVMLNIIAALIYLGIQGGKDILYGSKLVLFGPPIFKVTMFCLGIAFGLLSLLMFGYILQGNWNTLKLSIDIMDKTIIIKSDKNELTLKASDKMSIWSTYKQLWIICGIDKPNVQILRLDRPDWGSTLDRLRQYFKSYKGYTEDVKEIRRQAKLLGIRWPEIFPRGIIREVINPAGKILAFGNLLER